MFVYRCVKLKFQAMNVLILMTLERKISLSNCEGHLSLIFTLLLCTDGMKKKYFYCTVVKFVILYELILCFELVITL